MMKSKRARTAIAALTLTLVVGGFFAWTQKHRQNGSLVKVELSEADVVRRGSEYRFRIRPALRTRTWGGIFSSRFDWRALAPVSYGEYGRLRPLNARMVRDSSGGMQLITEPPRFAESWSLRLEGKYVEELKVLGFKFVVRSNQYQWVAPWNHVENAKR